MGLLVLSLGAGVPACFLGQKQHPKHSLLEETAPAVTVGGFFFLSRLFLQVYVHHHENEIKLPERLQWHADQLQDGMMQMVSQAVELQHARVSGIKKE